MFKLSFKYPGLDWDVIETGSNQDALKDLESDYKRAFGDDCSFKIEEAKEKEEYKSPILDSFWDNNQIAEDIQEFNASL